VKRKRETFTLTRDATGQSIKALVLPQTTGGKFMKLWQDTGLDKRLKPLQGVSMRVLFHLTMVAGWENKVSGTVETAKAMELKQPNVAKAYRELANADFLYQREGVYYLSPLFCWKGNEEQYEEAVRRLSRKTVENAVATLELTGAQA